MKQRFPDPRDVAAREVFAATPLAPQEGVLEQTPAEQRTIADQLRESQAKHPLKTHAEAIAQWRRFRKAMDEDSASPLP
jgi:hypothetical protein